MGPFSSLHWSSSLWQVEMDEASKPLTAFTVGLLGFYECDNMPFGLVNGSTTFLRLMETCLGHPQLNWCLIYLHNSIVLSKTPKDYLVQFRAVFKKVKEAGIKLKPSKCEFLRNQTCTLGIKYYKRVSKLMTVKSK